MLDDSPWPLLFGVGLGATLINVYYYISKGKGLLFSAISLLSLLLVMALWFRDIIRESTMMGSHTEEVSKGLHLGIILFIVSEVMFFFSFFFSFFFLSLSPSVEGGGVWPPTGVVSVHFSSVPLLNTLLLLSSGVSLTWAHHSLLSSKKSSAVHGLGVTIFLGVVFTILQVKEYFDISFTIADGVYGSLFFIMTGFHGIHVIVGNIFLIVSLFRVLNLHFSKTHHLGFEAGAWYWHFVDVVWLLLYLSLYWWGG